MSDGGGVYVIFIAGKIGNTRKNTDFHLLREHGNTDFVLNLILLGQKLNVVGEFSCTFACVHTQRLIDVGMVI